MKFWFLSLNNKVAECESTMSSQQMKDQASLLMLSIQLSQSWPEELSTLWANMCDPSDKLARQLYMPAFQLRIMH